MMKFRGIVRDSRPHDVSKYQPPSLRALPVPPSVIGSATGEAITTVISVICQEFSAVDKFRA
jgi:hypothetical protein